MKVRELIAELQKADPEALVVVQDDVFLDYIPIEEISNIALFPDVVKDTWVETCCDDPESIPAVLIGGTDDEEI